MPLDFPDSPTDGLIFSSGIKKWQWSDAEGSWLGVNASLLSNRNKLINAQGLINQRVYVSGTATTTANQYTVDRWKVVTSGQNLAFSTTANVVTFTAPAGGVEQVVEDLNVESGTYVLSWTGTATATVNGTARAKGETFSLTGGSNVTVRFSSGTFSLPQLEKGTSATPFEYRPFGSELALCQRYYETTYPSGRAPGSIYNSGFPQDYDGIFNMRFSSSGNSEGLFWFIKYSVQKRTLPMVTSYATYTGTAGRCSVFSAAYTYYGEYTVSAASYDSYMIANISAPAGGIPLGYYTQAHFVANAEL
jgi:hypothetical protein